MGYFIEMIISYVLIIIFGDTLIDDFKSYKDAKNKGFRMIFTLINISFKLAMIHMLILVLISISARIK
nr:MAG TPA: hypothetical protein [Caudoviricetes sp.]